MRYPALIAEIFDHAILMNQNTEGRCKIVRPIQRTSASAQIGLWKARGCLRRHPVIRAVIDAQAQIRADPEMTEIVKKQALDAVAQKRRGTGIQL